MGEELQTSQPDISRRNFLGTAARLAGSGVTAYSLLKTEPAYAAVKAAGSFRERRKQVSLVASPSLDTQATTQEIPQVQPGAIQNTPTPDATVAALQKRLLQDQVKQLETPQPPPTNWLEIGAPLIGSLGTVGAIVVGVWQFNKTLRNVEKNRLDDQRIDREKRDEDRFQKVLENLGSDKAIETRAGAANFLWNVFLDPSHMESYRKYYEQIFNLSVTYLRLRQVREDDPIEPDLFYKEVIKVFQYSVPLVIEKLRETRDIDLESLAKSDKIADNGKFKEYRQRFLNASRVHLEGADLYYLEYYFGKSTDLRYLDLSEADLFGATLFEPNLNYVDFSRANLDKVSLMDADLTGANPEYASSLLDTTIYAKGLTDIQVKALRSRDVLIREKLY